jgi:hypothetical protein
VVRRINKCDRHVKQGDVAGCLLVCQRTQQHSARGREPWAQRAENAYGIFAEAQLVKVHVEVGQDEGLASCAEEVPYLCNPSQHHQHGNTRVP